MVLNRPLYGFVTCHILFAHMGQFIGILSRIGQLALNTSALGGQTLSTNITSQSTQLVQAFEHAWTVQSRHTSDNSQQFLPGVANHPSWDTEDSTSLSS